MGTLKYTYFSDFMLFPTKLLVSIFSAKICLLH